MSRKYGRVVVMCTSFTEDRSIDSEKDGGIASTFNTGNETTSSVMVSTDVQLEELNGSVTGLRHFF